LFNRDIQNKFSLFAMHLAVYSAKTLLSDGAEQEVQKQNVKNERILTKQDRQSLGGFLFWSDTKSEISNVFALSIIRAEK
jgi:hypothetical protein